MKYQRLLIVVAAVVIAVSFIGLSASSLSQTETVRYQAQVIATLSDNTTALRDQVEDTGEIPVAPPAETVTDAPRSSVDGLDGRDGLRGPRGEKGDPGDDGLTGASATGVDGASGASGSDGADGSAGPAGADGANGAPGGVGAQGPSGSDGNPPVSWTYTDMFGGTHTCTRTDPFDTTNPTYTCD